MSGALQCAEWASCATLRAMARKSKLKHFSAKWSVPIFNTKLHIYVGASVRDAHTQITNDKFPKIEEINKENIGGDFDECCALSLPGNEGYYALLFCAANVDLSTVAHEVFHVTHAMLRYTNCNFDIDHEEQGAMLYSYLLNEAVAAFVKNGYKLL